MLDREQTLEYIAAAQAGGEHAKEQLNGPHMPMIT